MSARARKFLSYYRPYRGLLIADLLCAIVVAAVTLALPLCAGYVTRTVLAEQTPETFGQLALMGCVMVGLVALLTACTTFVDFQGHMMGAKMERDMRDELFAHYQTLSHGFYDDERTGQLMNRLTNDLFALSELYHHGPEDLAIGVLKFVGAFALLASINLELTAVIFLFMPVMAVYSFHFNRRMNAALMASRQRVGDINAQIEDSLAGIRVVKSFTNEAVEQRKFALQNERFLESRRLDYGSEAYFYSGMLAFTELMTIAVIVFGGLAITRTTLDPAELVTFLLYVGILTDTINRAVNFARLFQEGFTGFSRFMELLEVKPAIVDRPGAIDLGHARGHVRFCDVSFRYRAGLPDVFSGLSLDIRPGEYVALVGPSGVGKTTLCSLIPRFYEVSGGAITVDGHDVRDLTLASLRRNVGVVHQDVYLFAGTVYENIRYGRPEASYEEVVAAAKRANAHEFIMGLPNGYDTDIGQRGVKLSGGQKQRLSIARVFLKDPPIIIFDEATSALDCESERAVRRSLEALASNRTMLVIAHRLSTVIHAQRIVVLTERGVEEQGTHDELVAAGGAYAGLYGIHLNI